MRIIAFYLPQFHEIEENNRMWGQGFTEWTNVKKAKPFFAWHEQPVAPLDDNYYNLLDTKVIRWQAELAKQYGIYGFCFYHYWYNGHKLLEKPLDNFLNDKTIDIPFCICWANHDWTSSWADGNFQTIFKQNYDDQKEWLDHFNYLLPFFLDERYIKNDGKPLVVIYEANCGSKFKKMLSFWQEQARLNGLPGLDFAFQSYLGDSIIGFSTKSFSFDIEYQPQYFRELQYKKHTVLKNTIRYYAKKVIPKKLHSLFRKKKHSPSCCSQPTVVEYTYVWESILKRKPVRKNSIPCAFVRMDTTPRIQERGFITKGMTPELFNHYLTLYIQKAKKEYCTDMMFLFAWNEWAEGGYLEPDSHNGYKVLNAVRKSLLECEDVK